MSERTVKATLVSLARELGVSRQTVSNVINAPHLVKATTRARVQAAIERSGYRPSALGRALRTNRSLTLALRIQTSVDDINGSVLDRFLHAVADAAREASYRVTIFTASDDEAEVRELDALADAQAIDGCILTDTTAGDVRPAALIAHRLPLVAFGRPWGAEPGAHAWVDVDCAAGTREATMLLRERGHTRIGFLGWVPGLGTGEDRRNGWLDGVRDVLDDPGSLALAVTDGVQAGRGAAEELRARGATALICASDSLALGAFDVFAGDDPFVPIVGIDDTAVTRALGISSIAQPVEEAARFCIATVVTLLTTDADPATFHQLLTPTLQVRERSSSR